MLNLRKKKGTALSGLSISISLSISAKVQVTQNAIESC